MGRKKGSSRCRYAGRFDVRKLKVFLSRGFYFISEKRKSSTEEGQWLLERLEESVEALKQPLSWSGSESLLVKHRRCAG